MIHFSYLQKLNMTLFLAFIRPRSIGVDSRRQEYILNILLTALASVTTLALLISGYHLTRNNIAHYASSFIGTVVFSLIIYGLLWLSRAGHYRVSSYIFIALLGFTGLQLMWTYSFELPHGLLIFAVTIVISSVLVSARTGLLFAGLLTLTELTIGYFQLNHDLQPDLTWFQNDFNFGDASSYAFVLGLLGVVAWLSNREIDRSLRRARNSEADLAAERDNLEVKVVERTRELERTQLLRTMELQRFAEFGRLSANLLHEVASPLTAASLNLEQLTGRESEQVLQARQNLQQIERYVVSARKQLQSQSSQSRFSVRAELKQITNLLMPLAHNNQIPIKVSQHGSYWLYGDPVKFNQLLSNLIINAIDATKDLPLQDRKQIVIDVSATERWVTLVVSDRGIGIETVMLSQIFEPFYTTKGDTNRGMGIGLALVKQFAVKEFHGNISVRSDTLQGTVFKVKLKRQA